MTDLARLFSPEVLDALSEHIDARVRAALNGHREERRWLTVEQAAEYTGLSVSGVRRQIERGRLPVKRVGRRLLIDQQQLDRHLERLD